MPTCDQTAHHTSRSFRSEHQVGPSVRGVDQARRVGCGLQRPRHRRADRDDASARGFRGVHQPRRRGRDDEALRARRLPCLGRGDARVQRDRRESDTRGDQIQHQTLGERPCGTGHFRTARDPPEDGRVVRGRPPLRHIGIRDRTAVGGQQSRHVGGDVGAPETPTAGEPGRVQSRRGIRQSQHGPGREPLGRIRSALRPPDLHHPATVVQPRREVQHDRLAAQRGVDRGRHGRRIVHHQEVAGAQPVR